MQPQFETRLDATTYPDSEPWFKRFLVPLSKILFTLQKMLANGLTFADNFNAAIVNATLTHNTALSVANPLSNKPVGIVYLQSDLPLSAPVSAQLSSASVTLTASYVGGSGTGNVRLLFVGG